MDEKKKQVTGWPANLVTTASTKGRVNIWNTAPRGSESLFHHLSVPVIGSWSRNRRHRVTVIQKNTARWSQPSGLDCHVFGGCSQSRVLCQRQQSNVPSKEACRLRSCFMVTCKTCRHRHWRNYRPDYPRETHTGIISYLLDVKMMAPFATPCQMEDRPKEWNNHSSRFIRQNTAARKIWKISGSLSRVQSTWRFRWARRTVDQVGHMLSLVRFAF